MGYKKLELASQAAGQSKSELMRDALAIVIGQHISPDGSEPSMKAMLRQILLKLQTEN